MEAERGLYERRLAVAAANIGLIKNAKVSVAVPARSAFSWFSGRRFGVQAPVARMPVVPYAGTAVPVAQAMPVNMPPISYAVEPSNGGESLETPEVQAAVAEASSEAPLEPGVSVPAGMEQASQGAMLAPLAQPPAPYTMPQVVSSMLGQAAGPYGMQAQPYFRQPQQQMLASTSSMQPQAGAGAHAQMLPPLGMVTQSMELQPGTSYSIQV